MITPVVIRFDGGIYGMEKGRNYGQLYGSFRINNGDVVHAIFNAYGSSNIAELMTLITAVEYLEVDPKKTRLCIYSDSQITVGWIEKASNGKPMPKLKVKNGRSLEFIETVAYLYTTLEPFASVGVRWQPREFNVSIFGH